MLERGLFSSPSPKVCPANSALPTPALVETQCLMLSNPHTICCTLSHFFSAAQYCVLSYPSSPLDSCFWDCAIYHRNCPNIPCVSGAVEQRDDRYHIRRLHQMPACQCLLRAGTDCHGKDVFFWQFGLSQRSEHICSARCSVTIPDK